MSTESNINQMTNDSFPPNCGDRVALAWQGDEMGLGKTVQVIAFIKCVPK